MLYRLEISPLPDAVDVRGRAATRQAEVVLGLRIPRIATRDVYTVAARLDSDEVQRVLAAFVNPVIQRARLGANGEGDWDWLIVVGFLPGVTDNVGRTAGAAIHDVVGRPLADDEGVYSAVEYLLWAPGLGRREVERFATGVLANPLIQRIQVCSREDVRRQGVPLNYPTCVTGPTPAPAFLDLELDDGGLRRLSDSRTLALALAEMRAIQAWYRAHGRDPERLAAGLDHRATDVELEALAQTWSEHCKHKIFNALIEYTDEHGQVTVVDSLFRTCIARATDEIGHEVDWLRSVFKDNAGVIGFNDRYDLVYKVETHNSPSALDPYGGAMTGIVGVNRDPMGTGKGARLLVNVWGYCLASPYTPPDEVPDGLLHPRLIRDGVHRGVIEGGNQSGIPWGLGWEYYDQRYLGKPLVFCGTVGLLPRELHGEPGHHKSIRPGDLIVMAGGRIGKDGIHGATFSSEALHATSPVQAVQIGDPITQKRLSDFLLEARDLGLYRALTDNGAGGLSSSIGEMARECGGCRLDLSRAPLKYPGLAAWEILLSEAQERMSFAVPPEHWEAFRELAARREVEVTALGEFTASGWFHVVHDGRTVARLAMDFLHDGCPRLQLRARWTPPTHPTPAQPADPDLGELLTRLMGRLNLASWEAKGRQYDHEVKGLSVIKPFVGVGNNVVSDASVFMVEPLGRDGIVLAAAACPAYGDLDTYHMVANAIDLAVRRTLAVGGCLDHLAGLDNFCWPDPVESPGTPDGPYKLAQLVRANQALYDYTRAYRVPCISGKDSMKNDSTRGGRKISVPPTLLFSTIGRIADVGKAMTLAAKRVGDLVYLLGTTAREFGGSEYYAMLGGVGDGVPVVDAPRHLALYRALARATDAGLCHSAHAVGPGGLGAALARVVIAANLGMEVYLDDVPLAAPLSFAERLFSESAGRFLVTVSPREQATFEALLAGQPHAVIGEIRYDPVLTFYDNEALLGEVEIAELLRAYTSALPE